MERVCPECAEKDKEIVDLKKKIVELQFYIDDLKESQEADKKKISEICRQLEKEKDRYNQLLEEEGSNEASKKKISELSKQLEEEKDKYNQLKKEKDSYEASNEKITRNNKLLEKDNNQLKEQNISLKNQVNNLLKKLNEKISFFPIPNYQGCSIVDALHSIGFESSFNYRKVIANFNRIGGGNYCGKPDENLEMLRLLCQGRLIIPPS